MLALVPAALVGFTPVPSYAQAGCGAAMADFQAALRAETAEALSEYLEEHAPCFERPARARLNALDSAAASGAAEAPMQATEGRTNEPALITVRVRHSLDDVEEKRSDGSVYDNSTDLELTNDEFVGGDQLVGLRFEGLDIEQRAEISWASLRFQVDEVTEGSVALQVYGEANDDAARFAVEPRNVSDRPRTTAAVAWTPGGWGKVGASRPTPDLAEVIQEIVDRDGWRAGNSLVLFVEGSGRRTAESFDGDPAGAPKLSIEFVRRR